MNSRNQGSGPAAERLPARSLALAAAAALALAAAGCAGSTASSRHANDVQALQAFQIRDVQQTLEDRGYHLQATGLWDEPTRAAIAAFQTSHGLPSTGELTWATARALRVDLDPRHNCEVNNSVDCYPLGGP